MKNNTCLEGNNVRALRSLRGLAFVSALLFALGGGPGRALAQTSDFNNGSDDGWCRVDPLGILGLAGLASWTLTNGTYTLHCDGPPIADAGPARLASIWTNQIYLYTDFYVSVDVTNWSGSPAPAVGILARLQDSYAMGVTEAYSLTYEPTVQDFQISTLYADGSYAQTAVTKANLPATNWYRFVFLGRGDYLEARVYAAGATVPLATISANEGTYQAGWCGIFAYNSQGGWDAPAEATFDNYLAQTEEPPPLTIQMSGTQVQLGWPSWANSFKLQSSTSLTPVNWGQITSGIVSNETGFSYTCPATNRNFFRLSLQ